MQPATIYYCKFKGLLNRQTYKVKYTTSIIECTIFNIQDTMYNMPPVTYNIQLATCTVQCTNCIIGWTTYRIQHIVKPTTENIQKIDQKLGTLYNIVHTIYNMWCIIENDQSALYVTELTTYNIQYGTKLYNIH